MSGFDDSFREYAQARGLEPLPGQAARPLTPLLAKEARSIPWREGGSAQASKGIVGVLGYHADSYSFPIVLTEIQESQAFVPRLFCERRGRSEDTVHYGFEIRHEALWTESEVLNRRYKVTTGPFQDPNWMRQLFSPTFIDWLGSGPPEDFSFELAYGALLANTEDEHPDAARLDALCEAAATVARRVREECAE